MDCLHPLLLQLPGCLLQPLPALPVLRLVFPHAALLTLVHPDHQARPHAQVRAGREGEQPSTGGLGARMAGVPLMLTPSFPPVQGAAAGRDRALLEHLPLHSLQLPLPPHLPWTHPAPTLVRHSPHASVTHPSTKQEAHSPVQESPVRVGMAGWWEPAAGTAPSACSFPT